MPRRVTYSQVQGIRGWTSLRGHCSASHVLFVVSFSLLELSKHHADKNLHLFCFLMPSKCLEGDLSASCCSINITECLCEWTITLMFTLMLNYCTVDWWWTRFMVKRKFQWAYRESTPALTMFFRLESDYINASLYLSLRIYNIENLLKEQGPTRNCIFRGKKCFGG